MNIQVLTLMAVAVIGLGFLYLLFLAVFRILKAVGEKGPEFSKGVFLISGIIALLWIYFNPEQAQSHLEYALALFDAQLGNVGSIAPDPYSSL